MALGGVERARDDRGRAPGPVRLRDARLAAAGLAGLRLRRDLRSRSPGGWRRPDDSAVTAGRSSWRRSCSSGSSASCAVCSSSCSSRSGVGRRATSASSTRSASAPRSSPARSSSPPAPRLRRAGAPMGVRGARDARGEHRQAQCPDDAGAADGRAPPPGRRDAAQDARPDVGRGVDRRARPPRPSGVDARSGRAAASTSTPRPTTSRPSAGTGQRLAGDVAARPAGGTRAAHRPVGVDPPPWRTARAARARTPADGDPFTADEDRMLVDLARQLGLALHNMRLDSALEASVRQLEQRNAGAHRIARPHRRRRRRVATQHRARPPRRSPAAPRRRSPPRSG